MGNLSLHLQAIPNVLHGFGNATALLPTPLAPFIHTLPNKKQVHGTHIVDVTAAAQSCGEADGCYTRVPGVLLTVLTADCLPVIFSRRDGQAIGVVHAGWRGLLAGILERMVERITQDDRPSDWVAAVGPAAGSCCYQVDEALTTTFIQALPQLPPEIVSPRYRYLDLGAIATAKLRALGLHTVDHVGHCTVCSTTTDGSAAYTSYRRTSQKQLINPAHPGIAGRNQHAGIIILP